MALPIWPKTTLFFAGGYCVIKQIRYKPATPKTDAEKLLLIANPTLALALANERNRRRFRKEARIMARLGRHSQLPCLLDHFSENNLFYLVQEYIPGETLKQELNRTGPQSEAQVKACLQQIIPAIRHVHQRNLMHLDIKPANLMRRSHDQKIVLIDFGTVSPLFQRLRDRHSRLLHSNFWLCTSRAASRQASGPLATYTL